jgi:ISXO2-like transposase domain
VTSQKSGVSALGMQRVLGLGSDRTAWNLLHKLRRAMVRPGRERLNGIVEVDEIFIGGPRPGKRGRGTQGKVLVVVAAQQAGEAIGPIRLTRACCLIEDAPIASCVRVMLPGRRAQCEKSA